MIYCDFSKATNAKRVRLSVCSEIAYFNLSNWLHEQDSKSGWDTSKSNRFQLIFTSRKTVLSLLNTFQFRSKSKGTTSEEPWTWHRGYSWPQGRELRRHAKTCINRECMQVIWKRQIQFTTYSQFNNCGDYNVVNKQIIKDLVYFVSHGLTY
jgi:hypothetical protein